MLLISRSATRTVPNWKIDFFFGYFVYQIWSRSLFRQLGETIARLRYYCDEG